MMQIADKYAPQQIESKWYDYWMEHRLFHSEPDEREPYTIVIPPPNVTGMLHMGHMLNNTLQDVLVRRARMQGKNACWVPGTDHASIATEAKVVAKLKAEGIEKSSLSREEFLRHAWDWKEKYGGVILQQLRKLGASCDWERTCFTMDEARTESVLRVFCDLYEKGLIYRGVRMVNWDPSAQTALSDEEVVFKESHGKLYYLRYRVEGTDRTIIVATTRPETILGDTALCVNPDDERYAWLPEDARVIVPLVGRSVPVIRDTYVDIAFGTGALKVTPAHDVNDYMLGEKYGLESIDIFNDDGTINDKVGMYVGQDRFDVRRQIEKDLDAAGLLEKTEEYTNNVGYSERTGVAIEPKLSMQWFLSMQELAVPATKAVMEDAIRFVPEKYKNTYRHWMENIKDWCISRQLWWGHRIPAYTCAECGELVVSKTAPSACPKCGCARMVQEEDVLDTWFSSWLWPFSTFGWPQDTEALRKFYPTQSLVTGPDIIFFWVARMIMAGIEFMGDIPFRDVYFTSIIRDEKGRKMSKSLNNSPDPLDVIAEYGADALRFTIIYIAPIGQDIKYANKMCEIGRNFANKIWNVVRFRQSKGVTSVDWASLDGLTAADLRPDDQWIIASLNDTVREVTEELASFRFNDVSKTLYDFIWNKFCDWYLESCKPVFGGSESEREATVLRVFDYCLATFLRLLHPVMPFVTDELYHQMGFCAEDDSIMRASWPVCLSAETLAALGADAQAEALCDARNTLISNVRAVRSSYNIPNSRALEMVIAPSDAAAEAFLRRDVTTLKSFLNCSSLEIRSGSKPEGPCATAVSDMATAIIPLAGIIDFAAERARLGKQEAELTKYIDSVARKLSNEKFVSKAPAAVVEAERQKQAEAEQKLARVREQLVAFAEG